MARQETKLESSPQWEGTGFCPAPFARSQAASCVGLGHAVDSTRQGS